MPRATTKPRLSQAHNNHNDQGLCTDLTIDGVDGLNFGLPDGWCLWRRLADQETMVLCAQPTIETGSAWSFRIARPLVRGIVMLSEMIMKSVSPDRLVPLNGLFVRRE